LLYKFAQELLFQNDVVIIMISENKKRITLTKYVFTTNYNQSYRLKKKRKKKHCEKSNQWWNSIKKKTNLVKWVKQTDVAHSFPRTKNWEYSHFFSLSRSTFNKNILRTKKTLWTSTWWTFNMKPSFKKSFKYLCIWLSIRISWWIIITPTKSRLRWFR